jgi:hypothetical protein
VDKEIKDELEKLKKDKVISEETASVYLSEVRKRLSAVSKEDPLEQ